jgi:large subunit ribosomal protein L21
MAGFSLGLPACTGRGFSVELRALRIPFPGSAPNWVSACAAARPYPAQILMELFMYAVIKSGGKQHRVTQGETLKVELLKHEVGQTFSFDDVLMVVDGDNIKIGTPVVAGAKVQAEVISHGRHDKIRIVKFRRRKHYRKQAGHRQYYTELKITGISL